MGTTEAVTAGWNRRVAEEIMASSATRALIFTDSNGRVMHTEQRLELPDGIGELLDVVKASHQTIGSRLALGQLRMSSASYEHGTVVWASTTGCSVIVVGSEKANLGQLISQVRHVFLEGGDE